MNRLEFIGQTHQGTLVSVDDIVRFFDHMMAAYEIVRDVEDATVRTGATDALHSSLSIKVESPNMSKLLAVVAYINDTIHNRKDVYGKSFEVDAQIDGTSVVLFVRENGISNY